MSGIDDVIYKPNLWKPALVEAFYVKLAWVSFRGSWRAIKFHYSTPVQLKLVSDQSMQIK